MISNRTETALAPEHGGIIIPEVTTLDSLTFRQSEGCRIELSLADQCVYVRMTRSQEASWSIPFDELATSGTWADPNEIISAHQLDEVARADAEFDRLFDDITSPDVFGGAHV